MVPVESEGNTDWDAFNDLDIQHAQLLMGIRLKKETKVMTSPRYYQFPLGEGKLRGTGLGDGSFVVEGDVSFSLIRPSPCAFTSFKEDGWVYRRDNFISTSQTLEYGTAPFRYSCMSSKSRESMVSECKDTVRSDSFEIPPEKLRTLFKLVSRKLVVLNTVTWAPPWKYVSFK
jgi:hypothetical protein